MKLKILLAFSVLMVLMGGLLMAAQAAEGIEIDPGIAETVMVTGIGGMGVAALTELLKRILLKAIPTGGKIIGLVSAAVVSAGSVALYLSKTTGFDLGNFVIYTILVFGLATGLYKFTTKHNT